MKKRNFLFIPFILGMGIGLFSCNLAGSGGNNATYQNLPAIVSDYDAAMNPILGTAMGYLSTPSLTGVQLGECIYLNQFTINFDNQPSSSYYIASNIVETNVDQSPLSIGDTIMLQDNPLTLANVGGYAYGVLSAYYKGRFFLTMSAKDKNPNFRLAFNTKEIDSTGVKNLYLLANSISPSGSASADTYAMQAFDLSDLIYPYGRDTTLTNGVSGQATSFRYIRFYLKYPSAISSDGVPTYTTANASSPIEMYMFN